MPCSINPSFAVVPALFAWSSGTFDLNTSLVTSLAAADTVKQQCKDVCRARYRACFSLKQIPSFECRGVYQDCVR